MRSISAVTTLPSRGCCPEQMREELSHALLEALFELEVLPRDPDGAVVGLYAIMDDLQSAMHRTEALDRSASA
jgi:hypothetical protein